MIKFLTPTPALALALALTVSFPGWAQQKATDHSGHAPAAATQPAADLASGEVVKIDAAARKVTLKHGEIKSIGMPPMTMVYDLKDAAMARGLVVGDKVQFQAAAAAGGAYVVTELRRAK